MMVQIYIDWFGVRYRPTDTSSLPMRVAKKGLSEERVRNDSLGETTETSGQLQTTGNQVESHLEPSRPLQASWICVSTQSTNRLPWGSFDTGDIGGYPDKTAKP